jgi:hypothetical protein
VPVLIEIFMEVDKEFFNSLPSVEFIHSSSNNPHEGHQDMNKLLRERRGCEEGHGHLHLRRIFRLMEMTWCLNTNQS